MGYKVGIARCPTVAVEVGKIRGTTMTGEVGLARRTTMAGEVRLARGGEGYNGWMVELARGITMAREVWDREVW